MRIKVNLHKNQLKVAMCKWIMYNFQVKYYLKVLILRLKSENRQHFLAKCYFVHTLNDIIKNPVFIQCHSLNRSLPRIRMYNTPGSLFFAARMTGPAA